MDCYWYRPIEEEYHDVFDFIQGVLWAELWRGTIFEYIDEHGREALYRLCKEYPRFVNRDSVIDIIQHNPFSAIKIGVGTYKWKGDEAPILKALECGVKFIDTAPTYGFGKVEKALSTIDLKEVILGSKIPKNYMTRKNIHSSLKRTKDLFPKKDIHYQLHWPNNKYGLYDSCNTLAFLKRQNSIPSVGLCNCSVQHIKYALGFVMIDTLQIPFNPFRKEFLNYLIPFAKESNIRVIAHSPFGQDFKKFMAQDKKKEMFRVAKKLNCTIPQLILAWIIHHDIIPIPKTNSSKHMEENLDSVNLKLPNWAVEIMNNL